MFILLHALDLGFFMYTLNDNDRYKGCKDRNGELMYKSTTLKNSMNLSNWPIDYLSELGIESQAPFNT